MTGIEGLGFIASGLVLTTFCMRRLIPLRALAADYQIDFVGRGGTWL